MYCPSCGYQAAHGLSYCKQCGANLFSPVNINEVKATTGHTSRGMIWLITLIIAATAGITLGGLGLVFVVVVELFSRHFPVPAIMMLALFSLLMVLGTAVLLGRQLSRLISGFQPTSLPEQASKQSLFEQRPLTQIDAIRQPVASVTEHTTRTFEPSHKESRIT
ncbi:MAG TPA: hypothetical protein VF666_09765 [Pyrinomonadaceae bacterium]